MESLRLMPPVPMTFRKAAKIEYIDGVLVPKGTIFYVPVGQLLYQITLTPSPTGSS